MSRGSVGKDAMTRAMSWACSKCGAGAGIDCLRVDGKPGRQMPHEERFLGPGTPAYMAPEQVKGSPTATSSPRTSPSRGKFAGINEGKARAREAGEGKKRTSAEAELLKHLIAQVEAGELVCIKEQPLGLRLANGTYYHPDFLTVSAGSLRMTIWEAKGSAGWKLDAKGRVKWKAAGEAHRYLEFRAAIWTGKAEGFRFETYKPVGQWPPVGGVL